MERKKGVIEKEKKGKKNFLVLLSIVPSTLYKLLFERVLHTPGKFTIFQSPKKPWFKNKKKGIKNIFKT